MFNKGPTESKLDAEINTLLDKLESISDKKSEEYATIVKRLGELHKLKNEEKFKPVSLDTALIVAANIFGILWLTRYERENVIRSKSALGLVNLRLPR